jgi:hypothetical protein
MKLKRKKKQKNSIKKRKNSIMVTPIFSKKLEKIKIQVIEKTTHIVRIVIRKAKKQNIMKRVSHTYI